MKKQSKGWGINKDREVLFSVGIKDCRVDTFRAGGKGGQAQNKLETGVRVVHEPSGAVGEARDSASQLQNKREAFKRMAKSDKFKLWIRLKAANLEPIDKVVDKMMDPSNIKTEVSEDGKWKRESGAGN